MIGCLANGPTEYRFHPLRLNNALGTWLLSSQGSTEPLSGCSSESTGIVETAEAISLP